VKYKTEIALAYFKECGLPRPEVEYRFHSARKWRFDFCWPKHLLALEVQGGLFVRGRHNQGAAMLKEHEKLNAAAILGYRIMYTTPRGLCTKDFVTQLKEAMK